MGQVSFIKPLETEVPDWLLAVMVWTMIAIVILW